MALGLSRSGNGGGNGEFQPYCKYDAKAGRLFRIDRVQDAGGNYSNDTVEITNTAQFVADLANIRVGWIYYSTNGPIRILVGLGKEAIPPKPADKGADGKPLYKQGFELDILLDNKSGGAPARVINSTAGCVIDAIDEIHDIYNAAPESKAGKLPVVKIASVSPVKSGQSTNYKPIFAIVSWVDRPAALATTEPAQTATTTASPPATGSTVAPPPTPAFPPFNVAGSNNAVPQPAASASDFG
jgi:hypothetical protein